MRTVYLICYDIATPKRLRQVHKTMKGFGDPLQFSVFRCELTRLELHDLKERLWEILHAEEDRVMIARLGPIDGRGDDCIEYWGAPLSLTPSRGPTIV